MENDTLIILKDFLISDSPLLGVNEMPNLHNEPKGKEVNAR